MCPTSSLSLSPSSNGGSNANTRVKLGCGAIGKGSVFLPFCGKGKEESEKRGGEAARGAKTFRGIERGVERALDGFSPSSRARIEGAFLDERHPAVEGTLLIFPLSPRYHRVEQHRIIFETSMILETVSGIP